MGSETIIVDLLNVYAKENEINNEKRLEHVLRNNQNITIITGDTGNYHRYDFGEKRDN